MDKELLRNIRTSVIEAMETVGKKHGVTIKVNGGTYSPTEAVAVLRLDIATLRDGTPRDLEAEAFVQYAPLLGLQPEDLGKSVSLSAGRKFIIAGYRPRARKNNITIKDTHGKIYVTSADHVKRALAEAAKQD